MRGIRGLKKKAVGGPRAARRQERYTLLIEEIISRYFIVKFKQRWFTAGYATARPHTICFALEVKNVK